MNTQLFRNKTFVTANLDEKETDLVLSIIKEVGGVVERFPIFFDYVIYGRKQGPETAKIEWAESLNRNGKVVSMLNVHSFLMAAGRLPKIIEVNGYSAEDAPAVEFPEYEAPVYVVPEIDVSGAEASDWEYEWVDDNWWEPSDAELWIKEYHGKAKHIIVPSYINGNKVTGLSDMALEECHAEEIEIPGTLLMGQCVGEGNPYVRTLTVGEGCSCIDNQFFAGAVSLEDIRLSRSVSTIDKKEGLFDQPDTFFRTRWFGRMVEEDYIIAGRILFCFSGDSAEPLIVPDGIRAVCLGGAAAENREIFLPGTVTEMIGNPPVYSADDFGPAVELDKFKFPDSLKKIDKKISSMQEDHKEEITEYALIFNHQLVQIGRFSKSRDTLVLPDGIEGICSGVFDADKNPRLKNAGVKSIRFPDTLKSIGKNTFCGLDKLRVLEVPENVDEIGENAFSRCLSLEQIILPESVRKIGMRAFVRCNSLKSVILPSKVGILGKYAICRNEIEAWDYLPDRDYTVTYNVPLKYVGIKVPTVKTEGKTFYREPSSDLLRSYKSLLIFNNTIYKDPVFPDDMIPAGEEQFETLLERADSVRSSLTIQINQEAEGDTVILDGCGKYSGEVVLRRYLGNAENFLVPENVTIIDDHAFFRNKWLKRVNLNNARIIGSRAFMSCRSLERVDMKNVTEIGDYAFKWAYLDIPQFPASLRKIGKGAFNGAHIRKADLHWLEEIPDEAFWSCRMLESVDISGAKRIGKKAFKECWELEHVNFDSVQSVGEDAFFQCGKFVPDLLPDSLIEIAPYAFDEVADGLVVPKSVRSVGEKCFGYSMRLAIHRSLLYEFRNAFPEPEPEYSDIGEDIWDEDFLMFYTGQICDIRYGDEVCMEITVLDENEKIIGFIPIYCDSFSFENNRLQDLFRQDNTFDYEFLDRVFFRSSNNHLNKERTALLRLKYPFELSDLARERYVKYLLSLPDEEISELTHRTIDAGDSAILAILCEIGVINQNNILAIVDYSIKASATACTAVLMNFNTAGTDRIDPLNEEL